MTRPVRPPPKSFEHFPEDSTCPICETNADGPSVLVRIAGTEEGRLVKAQPFHLACAVVQIWEPERKYGLALPYKKVRLA